MKRTPPPPDDAATPARVARRERRREHSREEIIEAARRVLLRDGAAATTLEAVAREVGLTKGALYYYFPSKDALLFEVVYRITAAWHQALHDAVQAARGGAGGALRAILRETVLGFAPRMDDFRLAFLHGQVAAGAVHVTPEQLARVRPLNDLAFAEATRRVAAARGEGAGGADVDARLVVFLASVAGIGLLTMKGMVESVGDPLRYSDEELVEGMARIFEAAVRSP